MFIFSSWHFHINSVSLILRQARIGAKERKGKNLSKLLNEKEKKKNQHPDSYQGNELCGGDVGFVVTVDAGQLLSSGTRRASDTVNMCWALSVTNCFR